MTGKWIQFHSQSGEPIEVQELTLTPQAQALVIRWPRGGFVWNRPTAVDVTRDGDTMRLPIVDVTRLVLIVLLLLPLFLTGIVALAHWASSQRRNEWIRI